MWPGEQLTDLLGVELPIIQAPMAGAHGSDLTIAVCEVGALGSLPCAMLSPEQVRSEVARIRERTDAPFNLNFFCHTAPEPDTATGSGGGNGCVRSLQNWAPIPMRSVPIHRGPGSAKRRARW